jgi:rhamnulokinase
MPARIQARCRALGQAVPEGPGPITRAILESLALKAALILAEIASVTGQPARRLHVVGGGAQIGLLNGLLARACGVPVAAGPVEATAMGNLLIQAQALGGIARGTLREVVRRSDPPVLTIPDQAPDMLMDLAGYRALLAQRVGSVVPG